MTAADVALIAPYPSRRSTLPSGVAWYTERLSTALADQGVAVEVVAPTLADEPTKASFGDVAVHRAFRRGGPAALPAAARAARRCGAPVVHLQYETFLYGGPASVVGVAPALAGLRRHGPVVTLHQVVDPASVDGDFTRVHRVPVPPSLARAGLATLQRTVSTLAATTVVHERAFERLVPDAVVVPHGLDTGRLPADRTALKSALGLDPTRFTALCFGFLSPYKGLEAALDAAVVAGDAVRLVVAGGTHPRLAGRDPYAADLRHRYGGTARFVGYVPDDAVADWFGAADVLLLPYPRPFASSGPFALALGYGTPVLCSTAFARCVGAPDLLGAPIDPAGLGARLLRLATDPTHRQAVASATAALADGRTWADVARRHIAIYEEVTHAHRSAGRRVRPGKPG